MPVQLPRLENILYGTIRCDEVEFLGVECDELDVHLPLIGFEEESSVFRRGEPFSLTTVAVGTDGINLESSELSVDFAAFAGTPVLIEVIGSHGDNCKD